MKCSTCQYESECPIFGKTVRFRCNDRLRAVALDLFVGLVIGLMAGFGLGLLFYPGFIGG